MKKVDSKLTGGIIAGIALGIAQLLPLNIRSAITLPLAIVGIIITINYIRKRKSKEQTVFFAMSSLLMIIIFIAYLEYKIWKTEFMVPIIVVLGYLYFITLFIIIIITSYRKGEKSRLVLGIVGLALMLLMIGVVIVSLFNN